MQEELQTLVRQREDVVRRIGTVKRTVAGLMALFDDYPVDEKLSELLGEKKSQRRPGLSKECRFALMNSDQPLSAREVCARVQERLPSLAKHKDALASVTTILNRLVSYGEAYDVMQPGGTRRWGWATDSSTANSVPGQA
jgi:predicted Zn-ribbon and HTH transcriptional regulator